MAKQIPIKPLPANEFQVKSLQNAVTEWDAAVIALSDAKELEADLRTALIIEAFGENELEEGTHKQNVGHGVVLNVTQPISRSVDEAALDAISTEENREVIDKVFSYVPKLSKSSYDDLSPSDKLTLHNVITEKPGMASAKLVRPKRAIR